jgi:hypothetical protein
VAHLGQGGGFDLSDAFSGDSVDSTVIEGVGLAVGESESQSDNAGLAFGQGGQHRLQLVVELGEAQASAAITAWGCSMNSPRGQSPWSPRVCSSETGSRAWCCSCSTAVGVRSLCWG